MEPLLPNSATGQPETMSEAAERASLKRKKEISDIQREKVEVEEAGLLLFDRIEHRYNEEIPKTTTSSLPPLTTILRCTNCSEIARGERGGGGDDSLPRKLEHVALLFLAYAVTSREGYFQMDQVFNRLTAMDEPKFWKFVKEQDTFQDFLNSYLQFRPRWYNLLQPVLKEGEFLPIAGTPVDAGLLFFFERVCQELLQQKCESNFLPGLPLLEISVQKKVIELPILLDLCAIYGRDIDMCLAGIVATNAIEILPRLGNDIISAANTFLSIVHSLHERLQRVLRQAEDGTHGSYQVSKECLQVLHFINDAIFTLSAFVPVYKGAAFLFCQTDGQWPRGKKLLNTLAMIHDSLLPTLLSGSKGTSVPLIASDDRSKEIDCAIRRLSDRVVWFAWSLAEYYYLSDVMPEPEVIQCVVSPNFESPRARVWCLLDALMDISAEAPESSEYSYFGGFVGTLQAKKDISTEIRTFAVKAPAELHAGQHLFLDRLDQLRVSPESAGGRMEFYDWEYIAITINEEDEYRRR